ncbi:MAG: DEAD/DEAH box helicase [Phycisphaerae bacterium]|nr:DEAD/DEAH box helicase [Phycisphaerae bacterium]
MIAVHGQWTDGALVLWGERDGTTEANASEGVHPLSVPREHWPGLLQRLIGRPMEQAAPTEIRLRLPTLGGVPSPSPHLAHASGHGAHLESRLGMALHPWLVPGVRIDAADAADVLDRIEDVAARDDEGAAGERLLIGDSLRFFAGAGRLARSLIAQQRLVPALVQENGHGLRGVWQPWLHDEATAAKVDLLVGAMPPSARATVDAFEHQARPIVEDFLTGVVDAWSRRVLVGEQMIEAIEGRDPATDLQVAWLGGLLGAAGTVLLDDPRRSAAIKTVRRWIGGLEDRGVGGEWRLCFRLDEPAFVGTLGDLEAPGSDIVWSLTFHLQSVDNESIMVDAEDVWTLRSESATVKGRRVDAPQDLLLKELARAARIYRKIEEPMREHSPVGLELNTTQAYEFLREIRPLLVEQGFGVIVPEWWESPAARIGARLRLDAPEVSEGATGSKGPGSTGQAVMGLQALVGYEWQIAVGEAPLTLAEFEKLAASRAPLVRVGGRWVEVRPEDVTAALNFIRENPGGEMRVSDALRLAYRTDPSRTGVPITGLDATGWVATMLEAAGGGASMPMLDTPADFHGDLRPYQSRGLSWLAFLDSLGLGPCLADDMGLGKTIQLLALMVHERKKPRGSEGNETDSAPEPVGPTLLVVPMSIVSNWKREAERFAPSLRVLVHHGVERLSGEPFFRKAIASDLVITTYALAHRDRDFIELVPWHRVVLDEAQNIKNPAAKQSIAVRSLPVTRRIVLTGTPLENRLSELWSIMDFCNRGFLGPLSEFRSYFAVPIERYHDKDRSRRLRSLVKPFILRRLKTDPTVISDLPSKLETKEYCRLTTEQASLYESCVKEMLTQVDKAEGIRRRGLVLTALIRLKQICNHPAQLPHDDAEGATVAALPARSGKCVRLLELLDEVVAGNQQALVFTQFRQMAVLLAGMLRQGLDREVLVLHGGTPQGQRQTIVDRFQKSDGSAPILILSLKAGGVGLNLTAASHVFHFDRWWNPAVENQATDRAFRIGQTKTVNVHKFIVGGTLEDRIDQMIENKIALAEDVIGSGEDWLTELTTNQLRDILTLRPEAMADE